MAAERSNDLEKMLCFPLSLWFNRKNIEDMVETRLRNDFVWNLANKNYASVEEVTAQGSRLHFDLNCPYTCMVMKAVPLIEQTDHAYSAESAADTSAIKELLIEAAGMERLKIMVADRSLEFIIYLENTPERAEERIETYLNTVDGQMAQRFPAYRAHWGISEITVESPDFSQLYKNAALALSYCMNCSQRCYRFTYRDTKDPKYLDAFEKGIDYCQQYLADPAFGEWYGYLRRDGKPTMPSTKGSTFKGPFHLPRMLIMADQMLKELEA